MRKNKKFITIMVGLIIVVLLFSIIAIVAMYTSPQPIYQIPVESITTTVSNQEDTIQGESFVIGEDNQDSPVEENGEDTINDEPTDTDSIDTEGTTDSIE